MNTIIVFHFKDLQSVKGVQQELIKIRPDRRLVSPVQLLLTVKLVMAPVLLVPWVHIKMKQVGFVYSILLILISLCQLRFWKGNGSWNFKVLSYMCTWIALCKNGLLQFTRIVKYYSPSSLKTPFVFGRNCDRQTVFCIYSILPKVLFTVLY